MRDLNAAEIRTAVRAARDEQRALATGDVGPVAGHLAQLLHALHHLDQQADTHGANRGRDLHRCALRWALDQLLEEHADAADEARRIAAELAHKHTRRESNR